MQDLLCITICGVKWTHSPFMGFNGRADSTVLFSVAQKLKWDLVDSFFSTLSNAIPEIDTSGFCRRCFDFSLLYFLCKVFDDVSSLFLRYAHIRYTVFLRAVCDTDSPLTVNLSIPSSPYRRSRLRALAVSPVERVADRQRPGARLHPFNRLRLDFVRHDPASDCLAIAVTLYAGLRPVQVAQTADTKTAPRAKTQTPRQRYVLPSARRTTRPAGCVRSSGALRRCSSTAMESSAMLAPGRGQTIGRRPYNPAEARCPARTPAT